MKGSVPPVPSDSIDPSLAGDELWQETGRKVVPLDHDDWARARMIAGILVAVAGFVLAIRLLWGGFPLPAPPITLTVSGEHVYQAWLAAHVVLGAAQLFLCYQIICVGERLMLPLWKVDTARDLLGVKPVGRVAADAAKEAKKGLLGQNRRAK